MAMLSAIPALPVRNIERAVAFYRDRLAFACRHQDGGLAIMTRDHVELHLWEANSPGTPGAEPHIAGTASCRVRVSGLRELFDEYATQAVIHPNGPLREQWLGDSDFTILDADHNAIAFFEPTGDKVERPG